MFTFLGVLLIILFGFINIRSGAFHVNLTLIFYRYYAYQVEYEEGGKQVIKTVLSKEKLRNDDVVNVHRSEYDFAIVEGKVK